MVTAGVAEERGTRERRLGLTCGYEGNDGSDLVEDAEFDGRGFCRTNLMRSRLEFAAGIGDEKIGVEGRRLARID